jgi:hypothetical protein
MTDPFKTIRSHKDGSTITDREEWQESLTLEDKIRELFHQIVVRERLQGPYGSIDALTEEFTALAMTLIEQDREKREV